MIDTIWLQRITHVGPGEPDVSLDILNLWDHLRHQKKHPVRWWRSAEDTIWSPSHPTEAHIYDLVVGDLHAMRSVFDAHGWLFPSARDEEQSYPTSLRPFMGRSLHQGSLDDVAKLLRSGKSIFVKPFRLKGAKGRVYNSEKDLIGLLHLEGSSFWISEPVDFRAEWRFFVASEGPGGHARHKIVGSRRYRGDPLAVFDPAIVVRAVQAYEDSGKAPGGYALDFGRLSDGSFVLVEANAGYALGGYEVEPDAYLAVLKAWWNHWFSQMTPRHRDYVGK